MERFPVFARSFDYLPLTNFLTSSVNTNNVLETTISPGNGKRKVAKTLYTPRIREADIGTDISFTCASSNEAGMAESTCEIDPAVGVYVSESINLTEIGAIEEDNNSWIAGRVAAMFSGLARKRETQMHDQIAAAVGKFAENDTNGVTGGNLKTVRTLKASSTDTDLQAIEEIEFSKKVAGLDSMYIFGDGLITKYFTRLDSGCCADGYGVDLAEFRGRSGLVAFHDNRVEDALGADEFLMLAPGAAQLVRYARFDGPANRVQDQGYRQMVVSNPLFPGDVYDMTMKMDCGVLKIELAQAFTVCTPPTDYFALDDRMDGFNGILNGKVDNS